jgi:hypothetical protein
MIMEKTRGLSIMAWSSCLLRREAGYMSATGNRQSHGHLAPGAGSIHGRLRIDYVTPGSLEYAATKMLATL